MNISRRNLLQALLIIGFAGILMELAFLSLQPRVEYSLNITASHLSGILVRSLLFSAPSALAIVLARSASGFRGVCAWTGLALAMFLINGLGIFDAWTSGEAAAGIGLAAIWVLELIVVLGAWLVRGILKFKRQPPGGVSK